MRLAIVILAGLFSATVATAQTTMTIGGFELNFANPALAPKTDAQRAFVAGFKAAKAARDPVAMAALVHPASRACMASPVSKTYFDERMQRDASSAIPDDAKIVFVTKETSAAAFDQLAARGDLTTLPVEPTEIIGIDFTREERDAKGVLTRHVGSTLVRQLAHHEGALKLVEYCLTAKGEAMFANKPRSSPSPKP